MRKIYTKEHYIILYSDRGNDYIVVNTRTEFERGHTHIKGKQSAIYLIDCAIKKKVPNNVNKYFLVSLSRIVTDKKHKERLQAKIDNYDNRQHYVNINKGGKR